MRTKTCNKCGETKDATREYFHLKKGGRFGLHNTCKVCITAKNKFYREGNLIEYALRVVPTAGDLNEIRKFYNIYGEKNERR